MLENSFIHLHGVGEAIEQKIWSKGIRNWDDYLERFAQEKRYTHHCRRIAGSRHALKTKDAEFFAGVFASKDTWRAFPHFEKIAYVDIETTGLGKGRDHTTVVGLFDGSKIKSFVHGENLEDFRKDIQRFDMVVTFNGAQFDLPFLRNDMRGIKLPKLHTDLRWVLASLEVTGGLKRIEERFGFEREDDLKGLDGYDAVKLWQRYIRRNDNAALDKLVRYNAADISNLKRLMEWAYKEKRKGTGFDAIP